LATNDNGVREALEKCARRYHQQRQYENSREHKFWTFENCPADGCKEARKALGMERAIMPPIGAEPAKYGREPGDDTGHE
jgi:hypothetical protein